MNMPHRYVPDLTGDEIITLKEMVKNHDSYPVRRRAHAVLLSDEKSGMKEIARVCMVSRNSVSSWLKAWETEGIGGLYDLPRSGAPPELTEADIEIIGEFIKEHPDSHQEALFRMHISRSEKHPVFRHPAEGVSMLSVFTVRITLRNHSVLKTQYMQVLFPPALMNFQRCL